MSTVRCARAVTCHPGRDRLGQLVARDVVQDYVGRLAAELERGALDRLGASALTRRPARVEPVNETMSTSGWPARASPASGPVPETTLNTPAGSPASAHTSASTNALSG